MPTCKRVGWWTTGILLWAFFPPALVPPASLQTQLSILDSQLTHALDSMGELSPARALKWCFSDFSTLCRKLRKRSVHDPSLSDEVCQVTCLNCWVEFLVIIMKNTLGWKFCRHGFHQRPLGPRGPLVLFLKQIPNGFPRKFSSLPQVFPQTILVQLLSFQCFLEIPSIL